MDDNDAIGINWTEYLSLKKDECESLTVGDLEVPPGWCGRVWDGALCWSPVPPNTTAQQHCFRHFKGDLFDDTQNVTKDCMLDGNWTRSVYEACFLPTTTPQPENPNDDAYITATIYYVGYCLSLVVLCVAVWIFLYFKDLRCLRNTIHVNLLCTYILNDFVWLLTHSMGALADETTCVILTILLYYFLLTSYFWMFVEGLYLYILVVETFTRENIKLRVYLAIGWGTPLLVMLIWVTGKVFGENIESDNPTMTIKLCSWLANKSSIEWIYAASSILVLAGNVIFLAMIMWVLITKLRSANNVETQQYRKATKALLVLIPLFGVTFLLVLYGPMVGVYSYIRSFLLSTQGFAVALLYCFLNTEVQNTLRHHFGRWKEARDLGARRYTYSKDWSPNTRTESIRLYTKADGGGGGPNYYKKRESTASESTTMTLVGYGGSNRVSNGSMGPTLSIRAPVSPSFLESPLENAV